MAIRGARRIILAVLAILVLGFFLPPFINVNRYRARLASSISQTLGREVSVGQVSLRLLPQPGFDLENFEVQDDPAISPEYLLRAPQVTAYLRVASLWRGRLEIARLNLTDPSLNIVRASDGGWNIESLLARTSQIPSAPTGQPHSEPARRRFPYIEASGGRINFKFGLEKKPFSFTESDFALWLESENNWRMRLEGRPMRTDTYVTDVGTIKMEAAFQRNSSLRYTPVKLRFSWEDGQLGQTTKLITGRDRGWHGGWAVFMEASGTPADLAFTANVAATDFRRYDIKANNPLALGTQCAGHYSAPEEKLWDLRCQSAVGEGRVEVTGLVQGMSNPAFDLKVEGRAVALSGALAFLHHAKMDLPEDLSATGTADFAFTAQRAITSGAPVVWSGSGSTSEMALRSQALGPELKVGELRLTTEQEVATRRGKRPAARQQTPGLHMVAAPFPVRLGGASPATASAIIEGDGFSVQVAGDADVARALQIARALGIGVPKVDAKGTSRLNLQVSGKWVGFEAPLTTGTVQLKNVDADIPGLIEPIRIASANVVLAPDRMTVQNVAGTISKSPAVSGSVTVPRQCAGDTCAISFDLHADELSLERLNTLLNPSLRKRPWYNFFMPRPATENPLATLKAQGRFTIERVPITTVAATKVAGNIEIAEGRAKVSGLSGDFLGGHHSGEWAADFTKSTPEFRGTGTLKRAAMVQLASVMRDPWAAGALDVNYELSLTGLSAEALLQKAKGSAEFTMRDATLRHISLDGKAPGLRVPLFSGKVQVENGTFSFSGGKLHAPTGVYTVDGSATLQRKLQFQLAGRHEAFTISGTLEKPQVVASARPIEAAEKQ